MQIAVIPAAMFVNIRIVKCGQRLIFGQKESNVDRR